jgi:hypothetical protein
VVLSQVLRDQVLLSQVLLSQVLRDQVVQRPGPPHRERRRREWARQPHREPQEPAQRERAPVRPQPLDRLE